MKTIKVKNWSEIPYKFTGKVEYEGAGIEYFLNGKLHRLDGAAYIAHTADFKQYWINGKCICNSTSHKNPEQTFYNSKQYKIAKQQEDLLNNLLKIKNINL